MVNRLKMAPKWKGISVSLCVYEVKVETKLMSNAMLAYIDHRLSSQQVILTPATLNKFMFTNDVGICHAGA